MVLKVRARTHSDIKVVWTPANHNVTVGESTLNHLEHSCSEVIWFVFQKFVAQSVSHLHRETVSIFFQDVSKLPRLKKIFSHGGY